MFAVKLCWKCLSRRVLSLADRRPAVPTAFVSVFNMIPSWSITIRLSLLLLVATALQTTTVAADPAINVQQRDFFESKIRPVLVEHCYSCHNSNDAAEGGLALDHRGGFLRG